MLVLSRHKDEMVCIGDNIKIMVLSITEDRVRLGIDAPRDYPVHRKEIWEDIKRSGIDHKHLD